MVHTYRSMHLSYRAADTLQASNQVPTIRWVAGFGLTYLGVMDLLN